MRNILLILFLCCCSLFAVVAQTYKVGDLYTAPDGSRGIVYYVFPDNSGGWVVALNDASVGCGWGAANDVPGLENRNSNFWQTMLYDTAGYANTQLLRNYQGNSTLYAAGKVDFAHGWVLPSPAQISMLYGKLPFISSAITEAGGSVLANEGYWCSAEQDASYAWRMNFDSGSFWPTSKTDSRRVRSVRSFACESSNNLNYVWSTGDNTPEITVSPEQTTTYTVTVSTPIGGNATAQHIVEVNSSSSSEFTITSETPYIWNGTTYSQSGSYPQTFTNAAGCDSVVTLHLTISDNLQVTITASDDTICDGEAVILQAIVSDGPPIYFVPTVAIGDILCTDGSIVKPSSWPVAGKTAKGVVFYVDNTGEHGWAMHLQEQATNITWGNSQLDIPDLPNYSSTDIPDDINGYSNTQIIRAAGSEYTYPAAWAVDFDDGWYLPAAGQLSVMSTVIMFVNPTLSLVEGQPLSVDDYYSYWSSTECSATYAWRLENTNGVWGYHKQMITSRVRSVCTF